MHTLKYAQKCNTFVARPETYALLESDNYLLHTKVGRYKKNPP